MIEKTMIVTGANRGIGRETAFALAGRGYRVIMACRKPADAEEAAQVIRRRTGNPDVIVMPLDLSSLDSVRAFASRVQDEQPRIDVLVNNAGVFTMRPRDTEDGIDLAMQVNFFAPFLLSLLLVPALARAGGARIVNVGSALYARARLDLARRDLADVSSGFKSYSASKMLVVLGTIELAERLEDKSIAVNALHPGFVSTGIMALGKWYDPLVRAIVDRLAVNEAEGAKTSVYLAVSEDVAGITGGYFRDCAAAPLRISAGIEESRAELLKAVYARLNLG